MSPEVKLTCEEVRSLLSEYADRELPEDDVRRVEEHLRTCKDCAFESTIVLNLKKLVEVWDGVKPEEGFEKKVLERVKSAPRGGSPLLGYLLALVAAVFVASGIVFWAFHERSKRQRWRDYGEPVAAKPEPKRPVPPAPVPEKPKAERPAAGAEKPGAEPQPPKEKEPAPPAQRGPAGLGAVALAGEGAAILRGGKELGAKEQEVLPGDSLKGRMDVRMRDGLLVRVREGAAFSTAAAGANGEVKQGAVVFDYSKARPLAGVYKVKAGEMLVSMRKEEVVCAVERRADGSTRVSVLKDRVGLRCSGHRGKPVSMDLKEGRRITLKSDGTIIGPEPSIDGRLFE